MSLVSMDTWIWWISICQFLRQVGMGFVLMPITTWSLNCLEPKDLSAGSAVTNTVRQIAGAVGAPVLVILLEVFTTLRRDSLGQAADAQVMASVFGVQWALRVSAVICLIMALLIYFGVKGDGAGSGRDMTRRALRRMHIVHAPSMHIPSVHMPSIHLH
jgi:energy-coupling factor transporter transmembrane protein EcfT